MGMDNPNQEQVKKGNFFGDAVIGFFCFILCAGLAFFFAGISRGSSLLVVFFIGFIGLFGVSAQTGRSGLIMGFIGSIVFLGAALILLISSLCGWH
jgi:hypothetical protein